MALDQSISGPWQKLCQDIWSRPSDHGQTHALVVAHRGAIVHEWYGPDHGPESTLISWSIAKSITHALIGIAINDGLLHVHQNQLRSEWNNDERSTVTIDDLLSMRSGLSWVEDYIDGEISDVITMLFSDSDVVNDHAHYAASKLLEHKPSTHWSYSSGTTNILCAVLGAALGGANEQPGLIQQFMQERLFGPTQMDSAKAKCDASGTFVGSSFVYATARDFVRFGELYRNDGVVGGQRILPVGWVATAQQPVAYDPETSMSYARHWWVWPEDEHSMIAHGYQGQILWISPQRELVVAHLGNTDAAYGASLRDQMWRLVSAFPVSASPIGHDGTDG